MLGIPLLLVISLAGQLNGKGGLYIYLPLFACGMAAAQAQSHPRAQALLRHPLCAGLALVAFALAMLFAPTPYSLALLGFALLFFCLTAGAGFGRFLHSDAARVLGECFYAMYLLHGIALSLLFTEGHGLTDALPVAALPLLLIPLAPALVLITAALHIAVERPAIAMGQQIASRWQG